MANTENVEMRPYTGEGQGTEDENTRDKQDAERAERQPTPPPDLEYPSGFKFWLALTTLCLGIFLITLDSTIVATAIPYITDEFHSLKDVGWYGSIYLMALCISQLLFGKLTSRYSARWVYTGAMFVFLVGSALCGAAPNSPALIAGRAIAGLGSSGLLVVAYSLVPTLAPPDKRALFLSVISLSRSVAATAGPLIGGALTQGASWRWTFYINLPLGAVIYAAFLFSITPPKIAGQTFTSFSDFIQTLDLLGLAALVPAIVSLLLALQWGGIEYPWSNGRIIALLVVAGVLVAAFIVIEFWQDEKAVLPSRIFTQRSISYASLYGFVTSGAIYVLTFYLPEWFQGVKGASPLISAVYTLPWLITSVVTLLGGGALISKFGYADVWMLIGSVFGAVGSGLFTTFTPDTNTGKWIGYQIIFAIGSSLFSVTPLIVAQSRLSLKDTPIGTSMVIFAQVMGSSIFVSVAQALFANNLAGRLQHLGIPGVDAGTVATTGITSLTKGLTGDAKSAVLSVINDALTDSWRLPIVLTSISIVGALGVEHRKPKDAA
ncbi:MFS general substrate transporter [Xylariaceae sp. AK1471]|nr:MFS general substrate transporter [Xylariaceae sp. AK1471]